MTLFFEITVIVALCCLSGCAVAFVGAMNRLDSDIPDLNSKVNRIEDKCHEAFLSLDTYNDRLEALNYSLTDLNNLLTQYNENLDHVIADREKLGKDVDILKETTLEFKMLVAKYAASVYDAQHEIREQMDSLGRSQQLILESMASVFHKIPVGEAKKIFGGEAHDEKPTGDDANEDDLQDEVSGE